MISEQSVRAAVAGKSRSLRTRRRPNGLTSREPWALSLLLLLVACRPGLSQEAPPPEHPGRPLLEAASVSRSAATSRCLELGWDRERATISNRLLSEECRVVAAATIDVAMDRPIGSWARYRRTLVYGPDARTLPADSSLFPDTLREDELVLFMAGPGSDSVRPIWHDRSDARIELIRDPRFARLSDGSILFAHRRCLNGTGGCADFPYELRSDQAVAPLEMAYLADLRSTLPSEWGTWKGVWLDPDQMSVRSPVYLPGDANCCNSFSASAGLLLRDGRLTADSVQLAPETRSAAWVVEPERRFGYIRPRSSLDDLTDHYGASQVRSVEVYLAEGFCTPGAVILPGTPQEIKIAWADTVGTRPAFVRTHERGGPWHTPSGVRVGSTLDSLEIIAGEPLSFSGFGWDYGGGLTWEHDGESLILRIAPAPYDQIQQLPTDDPRADELFGDRIVRSDHPLVRRLNIEVQEIRLDWARPAIERECENQ